MKKRWDGSIQSNNTAVYSNLGVSQEDYAIYRCMITNILYTDDPQNISQKSQNPEVLYEVVIIGGSEAGQTLSNCRLATNLNGNSNYSEHILKATTKNISKVKLSEHDGDIVYVFFIQGQDAYPVIMGLAKGIKNTKAAKKADGPRFIKEYNAVIDEIDNKGQLKRSIKTGEVKNGEFVPKDKVLISEDWTIEEKSTRTFMSGLTIVEDGKNDIVTIITKGGPKISLDGKSKKASFEIGASTVTLDGSGKKAEIKAGGSTITMAGTPAKISIKAGSAEIEVDGATGKISLKGQFVDLGSNASDMVTMFSQLATAFASHIHTATSPGAPTTPPMAPLLPNVGSLSVRVTS
jgi:hypothetical protein